MTAASVDRSGLPFTAAELAGRVARTRDLMRERGLEALLVFAPHNYYYLTGFQSGLSHSLTTLVLPLHGKTAWIVRKTELSNVRALPGDDGPVDAHGVADDEDYIEVLARVLASMRLDRGHLGIDMNALYFNVAHERKLRASLPGAHLEDGSLLVEKIRMQKSETELAYLRRAGALSALALKAGFAALVEGMTDTDLAVTLMSTAFKAGSERMGMLPFVASGPRTAQAHATWIGRPIGRNEVINAELAAAVERYHVPVFRVASIGPPPAEIARMHDASQAALHAGLERIRAGMTSGEADATMRRPIERAGYGDQFVVRGAYSIGIGFAPSWGEGNTLAAIKPGSADILLPGMTFHLVPALYQDGVGCVCCSMPVAITETGVEALAPIEAKLFIA
jgi:Xaa-Pro dipeptidase